MDVVQRTEAWLTAHPAGSHFVWTHLYDPHDPYEPPPPYSEIYKGRLYDGEIAYADSALGHFLAYLKKHNRFDGALIIVVGDHGEGLGEHHEDTHGIFLYDSTIHVPLIVKLPNSRAAGREVVEQVRTTDILPTILDLLDIPSPMALDGASLKPLILDGEGAPRPVIGETDYPLRFGWAPLRSVRTEGFKFIEAPRPELYDLHSDPGELHNNYAPWDSAVQKLRKTLAESSARAPVSKEKSPTAVTSGTIDELHALGYLGVADARSSTDVPEPSWLPDPKDKVEEQNLLHTAMIASEDGQPEKARVVLEKLLQMNDKSSIGLSQLGRLEMASGNYRKAAGYLERAGKLRPDDAAAAFDYGQALGQSGDLSGARVALLASLKLNPNQFAARLLLGRVYFRLNDPKEAQDQFEAAAILQPQSAEAWIELAKVLIAQKKFAEAAEQLEQMAESEGNNPELYELLAQAYTGLGKPQEAQRARAKSRASQKSKRPE
jgi:tetratricopeptide (TPR) repeat protein